MKVTWITYRSDLEWDIQGSKYRSDAGWGCMLRTGQMLLFQAMKRHIFGDDFDWFTVECRHKVRDEYINLLRL